MEVRWVVPDKQQRGWARGEESKEETIHSGRVRKWSGMGLRAASRVERKLSLFLSAPRWEHQQGDPIRVGKWSWPALIFLVIAKRSRGSMTKGEGQKEHGCTKREHCAKQGAGKDKAWRRQVSTEDRRAAHTRLPSSCSLDAHSPILQLGWGGKNK